MIFVLSKLDRWKMFVKCIELFTKFPCSRVPIADIFQTKKRRKRQVSCVEHGAVPCIVNVSSCPGSGRRVRVLRLLRHLERLPRPGPGGGGQWRQWRSDANPDQDQLRQVRPPQRLGGRCGGGGGGGGVRGAPRQHLLRPRDHAVRQVYPGTECSLTSPYTLNILTTVPPRSTNVILLPLWLSIKALESSWWKFMKMQCSSSAKIFFA